MIELKPITEDNFLDAFDLKLAPGQEEFVSHPIRSLAQAYVYRNQCTPFGVYAEGKGMIPIIPVHSQARGRVFLPFADDDPKTAEIMSKIILLSEDTKIRDPEILNLILLCKQRTD